MPRTIFTGQGHLHFITFSTFGRRQILGAPRSRQIVISVLGNLANRDQVRVSGFVIMPDHVHAIFWFRDDRDLPQAVQVWKSTSAHYLKLFFMETNPDFISYLMVKRGGRDVVTCRQRRYYDFNIRTPAKLKEKLEYMHYNPVKKGLCSRPEDWRWSSALWYVKHRSVGVKIETGL